MAEFPKQWMCVFDRDRGMARCRIEDESVVDAAVTEYLDSGGTRDRVLSLTYTGGGEYKILASQVSSWGTCSLEACEIEAELDAAIRAKEKPWAPD